MTKTKTQPGFLLYHEDLHAMSFLTDAQLGALARALLEVSETGGVPAAEDPTVNACLQLLAQKVLRDRAAYAARCRQNSLNRRARGQASTTVDDRTQTETADGTETENETETVNEAAVDAGAAAAADGDGQTVTRAQVLDAAKAYGLPCFPGQLRDMDKLISEYGAEWTLAAVHRAGTGKSQTWGYVRGILAQWRQAGRMDAPGQAARTRTVAAQRYRQREYSEEEMAECLGVDALFAPDHCSQGER